MEQSNTGSVRVCPACSAESTGIHCGDCGEIMDPKRITLPRIFRSIPDIFFDVEHGLFYSAKMLLMKPGKMIRAYFSGDRLRNYKPLKYLLFIITFSAFLFIKFRIDGNEAGVFEQVMDDKDAGRLVDKNSLQVDQIVQLIVLPLLTLMTWLFYRKKGYNYGEHLLANCFFIGETTLFRIVLFPVFLAANNTATVDTLSNIYSYWVLGYYFVAYYDWMYPKKTVTGFLYTLMVIFVTAIVVALAYFFFTPFVVYARQAMFGE